MSWILWAIGGLVLFFILCRTGIIVPMVVLPVGMFAFTLVVDLILLICGNVKNQGFPLGAWIFAGIYLIYNIVQAVTDSESLLLWYDDFGNLLGGKLTSGRWFAILSIIVILVETPLLYWLYMQW